MQFLGRLLKLDRLYDINYGDQILRSIVKTTYAKKKVSLLLLMILTVIFKIHVDAILSIIFNTGNFYIDFCTQILISVILVIKSGWIYKIVEKFDTEVYLLTRYLINNYTENNYRKWKRNITLVICFYLIIYLSVIEINNNMLKTYIIQYMVCYFIIEMIEKKYYGHIFDLFHEKSPIFVLNDDNLQIKRNSIDKKINDMDFNEFKNNIINHSYQFQNPNIEIDCVDTSDSENYDCDKTIINQIKTINNDLSQQLDDEISTNESKWQIKKSDKDIKTINEDDCEKLLNHEKLIEKKNNQQFFILTDNFDLKLRNVKKSET